MQLVKWFKPKKTITPPPSRPLEPMLLARFKRVLHTQQLDIFANVLQLSLVNLQDTLSRKVLGKDAYEQKITLFDKTVDELYHGIIRLNDQLTKEGAWDRTPRRNLLLTIFVFYRILFRDLLTHLSPIGSHSSTQDRYSLIKRIPPQVIYQAGAEYWRLYELSTLIYGEFHELRLNQDLIPILTQILNDPSSIVPVSAHNEIAHSENTSTVLPEDCLSLEEHAQRVGSFIKWLEHNRLSNHADFLVNDSHLFIDSLNYESDVLFVSESLLSLYPSNTPDEIRLSLARTGGFLKDEPEVRYCVKGQTFPLIGLWCIEEARSIADSMVAKPCVIEPLSQETIEGAL